MKQRLFIGLGWLISLVFLYFALRGLSWPLILEAFSSISPITPLLMVAVYCLGFVLRAWRWKFLIPGGVSFADSLGAVVLGYGANNLLPARLGELVRAQALGKKYGISRSFVLASILVERVFDGLVLTGLLYLGISGRDMPPWAAATGLAGLLLFGGVLVAIGLLALTKGLWEPKINALPSAKLRDVLAQFAQGLTMVAQKPHLPVTLLATSLSVWLVEGLMFLIAIRAFDLEVPTAAALFVMGVVNLGILVPSAPGYLGAFQYFGTLALSAWQVPPDTALACIVLIHACQYVPITLWGLSYIPYFGFRSLGNLRSEVN